MTTARCVDYTDVHIFQVSVLTDSTVRTLKDSLTALLDVCKVMCLSPTLLLSIPRDFSCVLSPNAWIKSRCALRTLCKLVNQYVNVIGTTNGDDSTNTKVIIISAAAGGLVVLLIIVGGICTVALTIKKCKSRTHHQEMVPSYYPVVL